MLCDTAEVLVVLSPASLRASIRGEAGSILPDNGNGMKRWSSCPSSHGVLVAELAGLYVIPLPNPVPWANADHSLHLVFITDSYWIRTGASLFLLCIAGPVKDRVFLSWFPSRYVSQFRAEKQGGLNCSQHISAVQTQLVCFTSSFSLHSFQFLGFACVCQDRASGLLSHGSPSCLPGTELQWAVHH